MPNEHLRYIFLTYRVRIRMEQCICMNSGLALPVGELAVIRGLPVVNTRVLPPSNPTDGDILTPHEVMGRRLSKQVITNQPTLGTSFYIMRFASAANYEQFIIAAIV